MKIGAKAEIKNNITFWATENPREIRKKTGLNQVEFWSRIGVTQSGGSRYESGRNIPFAVRELLRLVHIEKVNLSHLNEQDMAIARLLKEKEPKLYHQLKKESRK